MEDPQPAPVKQVLVSPQVCEPTGRQAVVESLHQRSGTPVQLSQPLDLLSAEAGISTPGGPPLHEVC